MTNITPIVRTRYIGPTDFRGSRVSAVNVCSGTRITIGWDDALNSEENHELAATRIASKLGHTVVSHCSEKNGGYLFVCKVGA